MHQQPILLGTTKEGEEVKISVTKDSQSVYDKIKDFVKGYNDLMEEMWTDYMTNGKISPPTAIFLAKNWYGYKDVADVVVTPNNPLQDMNAEDARRRLIEEIPEEE